MTTPAKVSVWILLLSGIFAIMEIIAGISICFSPESVIETADIRTEGVDSILYMWGVRQFALGVIFAFAAIRRSAPMLTIAYIFFFVMFAGDLIIGIVQQNQSLIVGAVVMCLLSAALLYALNSKKQRKP